MTKPSERFDEWEHPEFDEKGMTKYGWKCQGRENLELAEYTDIGTFVYINAKNGVRIERDVQVGSHTAILSGSSIDEKEGKVILRENCKIGAHCTVMPGVEIGENSVIGAHSFVNKSIPSDVRADGVPVKVREEEI